MTNIENRIKKKIWEYFKANSVHSLNAKGYVSKLEYNLISGIRMRDFQDDFKKGSGNELKKKIYATHSSSALVVNTFARWRKEPDSMVICGTGDFNEIQFEKKCSTGLRGTPPNLDLFLANNYNVIGIESKFIEYLKPKKPLFSKSYQRSNLLQAEDKWWNLLQHSRGGISQHLDIAQLIKHYLGLRNQEVYKNHKITLLYLFWEPENWKDFDVFTKHRKEIEVFVELVKDTSVRFVAKSYPELWIEWDAQKDISDHVENLRSRYSLPI